MKSKRQERAERRATSKRTPHGRCIRQEYDEEVIGLKTLDDGRIVKILRGFTRYLHVTKGWRKHATPGLKYELAAS